MPKGEVLHHVMFDIDRTLVKSYDFDEECFISAISEVLGHEVDSDWSSYKHVSDTGILNEHLERRGITSGLEEIHHLVKQAFVLKTKKYLAKNPAAEVAGASDLIETLKQHDSVSLSIATGGWREAALLKLQSAGIDFSGVTIASSSDHYSRIEIMKMAKKKARVSEKAPVTYFGDAEWDKNACNDLGYNFVLVGNRMQHKSSVNNLKNTSHILSLISI
ncbi:HAD hydrolase-like protein [Marinomonas sp. C2222]|uniref:HAD hydrolase-like protein n=1 Tax=Marinomonas sargassi TaxID=2984494 RepID=A0ABT2YVA0_9GAMM|nr:HAD hydrolase-like protein [Marinomonas sargassi]MCV2403793.1 HAD hydrolase-like protein [Marinomonas sargassi]